jgi:hypothetical protein
MRVQENATGLTVRMTPEDRAGFARELALLSDDNSLIKGGKLDSLRELLATEETDHPGVPASIYLASK